MAWKKKKSELMEENMIMRKALEEIQQLNSEYATEVGVEVHYIHSYLLGIAQGKADGALRCMS